MVPGVLGFPTGTVVKNLPANVGDEGDMGSIPRLGRSLGEGNGNPLQYSFLGNPKDRGAWPATVHGVTKSQTDSVTEQQQIALLPFLPLEKGYLLYSL